MKNCPACGLVHAEFAEECDCGYSFRTGVPVSLSQNSKRSSGKPKMALWKKVVLWSAVSIAAPIGVVLQKVATRAEPAQSSYVRSDTEYERGLQNMVRELNAQFPMEISPGKRIDRVSGGPGRTFTYHYTLTDLAIDQVDTKVWRQEAELQVRSFVCTSPTVKTLRADGVVFRYDYADKNGVPIMSIVIHSHQC